MSRKARDNQRNGIHLYDSGLRFELCRRDIGPSVTYDEQNDCLKILTEKYSDTEAFRGKEDIEDVEKAKEQIILNSINMLMKRGI